MKLTRAPILLVAMLSFVGCDRRDPPAHLDSGPADDAGVGDDAAAGDAATRDAAAPPDAATPGACADDPTACAYPSRRLDLREPLVGVTSVDETTGRELPLVIRAPRAGGPYPVVLFEHGGGLRAGGESDSAAWGTLIASHGYVVVHVGHPETDPTTYAAICEEAGTTLDECMATPETIHTVARVLDLEAVLDDLPAIASALEAAGGPGADVTRVGVAGWSGGSQGLATLMGATRELSPTVPRFSRPDARPLAAVLLSPSGPGFHQFFAGADETSWSAMRGPTLVMTGQNDVKPTEPDLTGPLRRETHDDAPADGTHRLLYSTLPVGVGGHGTFDLEDRDSTDPRLRRLSAAIGSLALAFFDWHLEDDAAAEAYVASDRARQLAGDALYEQR